MNRENGYYWVKYHGDWKIFEWDGFWWNTGSPERYESSEFSEIDKRKIERL